MTGRGAAILAGLLVCLAPLAGGAQAQIASPPQPMADEAGEVLSLGERLRSGPCDPAMEEWRALDAGGETTGTARAFATAGRAASMRPTTASASWPI